MTRRTEGPGVPSEARRDEIVDALFVATLTLVGLVGFGASYAGPTYFEFGALGVLLGLMLAIIAARLQLPFVVVAAVTVVIFFMIGAATAPDQALDGFIPTAGSVHAMATAVVNGWKELLTTFRPIGRRGALLCIPYLLGLATAVLAQTSARRFRLTVLALLPPTTVLVLGILFGATHPQALALQGSGFAVLAIAWAAIRAHRARIGMDSHHRGRSRRLISACALVAAAGGLSVVVGPALPLANAHSREVLHIQPPFNLGAYPSPLSGFRSYAVEKDAASVYDKVLLTLSSPSPGTYLRIATMDSYNEIAWGVADPGGNGDQILGFASVGTQVPSTQRGPLVHLTYRVGDGYDNVWVPTAGLLDTIRFAGTRANSLANSLRLDTVSGSAVTPLRLEAGDRVSETAVQLPQMTLDELADATPAASPSLGTDVMGPLPTLAQRWAQGAATPTAAVAAIAKYLFLHGHFSNGGDNTGTLAGNTLGRLSGFVVDPQMAGDDEQFAATMALMANSVGVPARVVLGAQLRVGQLEVDGKDIQAWVELDLSGTGWSILPSDTYENRNNPAKPQPKAIQHEAASKPVPPPVNAPPLSKSLDPNTAAAPSPKNNPKHTNGFRLPRIVVTLLRDAGIPLLAVAALLGGVVAMKKRRRRRRRTTGIPAMRIAAGWREILDEARDLGLPVDDDATRREQARAMPVAGMISLAARADAATFAAEKPTEIDARGYWREVEAAWAGVRRDLSWWRRLKASISIRSLAAELPSLLRQRRAVA